MKIDAEFVIRLSEENDHFIKFMGDIHYPYEPREGLFLLLNSSDSFEVVQVDCWEAGTANDGCIVFRPFIKLEYHPAGGEWISPTTTLAEAIKDPAKELIPMFKELGFRPVSGWERK